MLQDLITPEQLRPMRHWRMLRWMPPRRHTIVELPGFLRDAAAAGLSEEDRQAIVDVVAADPLSGEVIRGSGGIRKVRFAGRGKGKSGGFRVMVAYLGEGTPVYLLAMLSKGDRGNFGPTEVEAMRALMTAIKAARKVRR